MSVNHSTKSRGIIEINFRFSLTWRYVFVAPALAGRHRRASFRPFVRTSVHPSTFNMGIL